MLKTGTTTAGHMITRRGLVAAASLAAPALLIGCGGGPSEAELQREAALPPDAPALYYVSAPDCPWCTYWETTDEPAFRRSAARARLRFVTLVAPTIRASLDDPTWPPAIRWVRDDFHERYPRTAGTPLFMLVREHTLLAGTWGTKGWTAVMIPAVDKATGAA